MRTILQETAKATTKFVLVSTLVLLTACASTPRSLEEQLPANPLPAGVTRCVEQAVGESNLKPNDIQVVSWNMFKGSLPGWRKDLEEISKDAHVILLQEAPLINELTDESTDGWSWEFAPGYKRAELQTGVMSNSTAKASRFCTVKHKEPWIRTPKAMLTTEYAIEDSEKTLLVANLHGINFVLGTRAYRRQMQALTALMVRHDGPIVIGGDFNDWRDKRTKVIHQLFTPLGLRQVEFESPHRITVFGRSIDHVYYRGLDLVSQKVYRVTSSDHNPVRVGFRLISE